jgi:hypothetical protein
MTCSAEREGGGVGWKGIRLKEATSGVEEPNKKKVSNREDTRSGEEEASTVGSD